MDHTQDPAQAATDLEAVVALRTRELQQALDRAQSLYDQAPWATSRWMPSCASST